MSDEDRLKLFVAEYNLLVDKYGFRARATLAPEQLGEVLQIRAKLEIIAVPGWDDNDIVKDEDNGSK